MKGMLTLLVLLMYCGSAVSGQTNCSTFDRSAGPFNWSNSGSAEHFSGSHLWNNTMKGSCSYQGLAVSNAYTDCASHAAASSLSYATDTGTSYRYHRTSYKDAGGYMDTNAGASQADAQGATEAISCLLPCGSPVVTISGTGQGGGFKVTDNPANPMFADQRYYLRSCVAKSLPPLPTCYPTGQPPYTATWPYYWDWDYGQCRWILLSQESPVIIDTKGHGFVFTDPRKGDYVTFDLHGDNTRVKVSWPKQGSGNMWLALPNEEGQVLGGKELFGNFTAHADGGESGNPSANGLEALQWYDRPDQGGDGNLILDSRDAIWPKLRMWDATRCHHDPDVLCTSQVSELHSLDSEGIHSISLVWDTADAMPAGTPTATRPDGSPAYGSMGAPTDLVGNQYKFYSVLNPIAADVPKDEKGNVCCTLHQKSRDGRLIFDVYLTSVP